MARRTLITTDFFRMIVAGEQWTYRSRRCSWRPATDVYETQDALVARMEIAGMKKDDFEITFTDQILRISGRRTDLDQKRGYRMMEIPFGDFCAEIDLGFPFEVDTELVSAEYKDGFLLVIMPKRGGAGSGGG